MNALDVLWQYREAFLSGIAITFSLVGIALVVGSLLGVALQLLCARADPFVRRLVDGAAFCLSAIPSLVVLFWLYYPAQTLTGVNLSPFWTASLALILLNTFSVYRITSDAVDEFPAQYKTTALVLGLNDRQIMRYIELPLVLRSALPRWVDQQVIILQTSVFASLISVEEIFRVSQRINSKVYDPVTIYTAMAIMFLITAGSALLFAKYLRARGYRDLSER